MKITPVEQLHELFSQTSGVCTDTRAITKNCLFFALKGANFNGNEFILNAVSQGALFAITDNENLADQKQVFYVDDCLQALQQLAHYHRKQYNIPVIAITGSNGKTTTKELIHVVLSQKFNTLTTRGNLNNHIGVPLTLLRLTSSHQLAVIEMGANHQGEIGLLSQFASPTHGIITNIGKAHLEGFGGVEGVIKGKTELYRHLANSNGKLIVNLDNDILISHLPKGVSLITYGFKSEANYKGEMVELTPFIKLSCKYNFDVEVLVSSNLIGAYNAENILCSIAIGLNFGIEPEQIQKAIESYIPDNSRSQVIERNDYTIILDAYNANPTSMKAALNNFKNYPQKKLLILGDMFELGEMSLSEHELVISEASQLKNTQLVFVGQYFSKCKLSQREALFFDDTQACLDYFKERQIHQSYILIKGSRGMKLERLLEVI